MEGLAPFPAIRPLNWYFLVVGRRLGPRPRTARTARDA